MNWFIKQKIYLENAKRTVRQIKNGEWAPEWNLYSKCHLTATRGDDELWIGNGAFFCEPHCDEIQFGLIFRHYVWWAAAGKLKADADRKEKRAYIMNSKWGK